MTNYFQHDEELQRICQPKTNPAVRYQPYDTHPFEIIDNTTVLLRHDTGEKVSLSIFGNHNLQNLQAAYYVCKELGISDDDFYTAIQNFKGAAKRLEKIASNDSIEVFKDFAHSPSKLQATLEAVKQQFPGRRLIAVVELHTYSSLNKAFLPQYAGTLHAADEKIVYFNPHTITLKRLPEITPEDVKSGFADDGINVFQNNEDLTGYLQTLNYQNTVMLFMSSGNYGGLKIEDLAKNITINRK